MTIVFFTKSYSRSDRIPHMRSRCKDTEIQCQILCGNIDSGTDFLFSYMRVCVFVFLLEAAIVLRTVAVGILSCHPFTQWPR